MACDFPSALCASIVTPGNQYLDQALAALSKPFGLVPFRLGAPSRPLFQDFEQARASALPLGWSSANTTSASPWATTTNPPPNSLPPNIVEVDGLRIDLKNRVVASVLAFLFPGLGHWYQGRYGKAGLFSTCILTLFVMGMILGGGRCVYASWIPQDYRWHYILQASVGLPAMRAYGAGSLSVTWDGDNLRISAAEFHFITGKPLERLKNGATVLLLSQLTLFTENRDTVFRRSNDRFAVSYDLWEEKFSVVRPGESPRSISHATAFGAETWCMDNLTISAAGLEKNRQFWLRFELRVADPKEEAAVLGELGINITRLIETFSRRPRSEQPQWTFDAGPLRLDGLKRTEYRTIRIG
jgi:hypothetical protein